MPSLRKLWPAVPPEPDFHGRSQAHLTRAITCLSIATVAALVNLVLILARIAL